ncbi:uncharacterized protein TRIADDRAFT_59725 [Trichoplax adhaerens]|uniref:Protein brambleberry n=1 Tax=Trichoplax adhaerens TaxID=10228 RepID=B3S694_TRIAD|nr:hypothetical protein TRIADDRAFT_59725 [Trichoplax adhaerens]EDV21717.1 hypothetical protein TRIADDRAFT_59725 [Trichoplax adhaerens]|eukprot:XP_002115865.1 hypothetical protein TRIADDRAFT_59725 [Trichoplax adhaerens]
MELAGRLYHSYRVILGATILLGLSLICNSDFTSKKYEQPAFEIVSSESISHGQKHLNRLQKWSETSQCWNKALMQFHSGCKHLSSVDQSRLAIALTNCHLARSGRPTFPCSDNQSIEECTRTMDKADFIIYTEFFTNAISICFFIRNQRWQEDTELIINQLSVSSIETAMKLKQSLRYHEEVLQKQNNSLENQRLIIQNERILKESIRNSSEDMTNTLAKTNNIALENYRIIQGAFSRIGNNLQYLTSLQMLLLGEFSTIYTGVYYVISILLAYLLTTTPSTANARIWLFIVLTINVIFERLLGAILHSSVPVDSKAKEIIYSTTWICRRIFIGISFTILVISYIKYRDYSKINNALLEKIAKQNMEIKVLLDNKLVLAKEVDRLSRTDASNSSAKIFNKHLYKQTNNRQPHPARIKTKHSSKLRDSGLSDNCESDVEIKAISRPKTHTIPKPKSVVKHTEKIPDDVATPERVTRSPTHYNLRQQFGYKMSTAKKENCDIKYSRSSTLTKMEGKNSIKPSQGLASVRIELFSEED